ncbi:solute:Na+ symporter, SSS family [Lentibacillus persicus]|uniref:Solute:Na+ symporter, SSS family n=1 Tax=Lentibacillus persicus TaxID=640948 RepID=A0A1I1W103_9BACI|nr:sodium:solute symporter family protein [Lentibacillus persicus]SFD88689.1 solute:Na+ symporter, SSS family [Lentibacillus persicus]
MVVFFLIILVIGYYSYRKVNGFEDYAVAGRKIPIVLLFATMAATATGGGATIGRVSYAYDIGIVIIAAAVGFVANQILTGLFIAPKMRAMGNVYTIGDIMGYYYGRLGLGISGIFTFIYSIGVYGVQILAMGLILHTMTGFDLVPLTIIASAIVVLYTWAGGMFAVIYTDALQFIILAIGITTAAILSFNEVGGISGLQANLDPSYFDFTGGWSIGAFIAFFLTFLLGEAIAPMYVQRYLTTKTPKDTKWGVTLFGVYYGFYTVVVTMIGLAGVILLPSIDPDTVLNEVILNFLPVGIVGLVFAAMMGAIMSSGDSLLNTSAVIFTRDIYQRFINKNADDKKLLFWSKISTIVVGTGGIAAALSLPKVLDLLMYTYSLWAPSIIPPIVIAVVWGKALDRKVSTYAGPPAIVIGLITTLVWNHLLGEPWGLPAIVAGIFANLIVFWAVHVLTKSKTPTGIFASEKIYENLKE